MPKISKDKVYDLHRGEVGVFYEDDEVRVGKEFDGFVYFWYVDPKPKRERWEFGSKREALSFANKVKKVM